MNLKQCPHCKEETLVYTQNADIKYNLENNKLIPNLNEGQIQWMNTTYLWCSNCLLSHKDTLDMHELKQKYDNLLSLWG